MNNLLDRDFYILNEYYSVRKCTLNNTKGYPNHVQGNINKCVRMKWTTETKFQGDAELGAWQNDHCTNNQLPYVCSHEQDP